MGVRGCVTDIDSKCVEVIVGRICQTKWERERVGEILRETERGKKERE